MDMSATSRIVPLSDAPAHAAAKTDSEVPQDKKVAEVKDTAAADLQPRQERSAQAEKESKFDRGYKSDEDSKGLVYIVTDTTTGDEVLRLPLTSGTAGERAYNEQKRQAEARRDQAQQDIVA